MTQEHSFSVDEYMQPKTYKNSEAIAVFLTRLLLLEPGTYQSHPECGIGLISQYRYGMEGNAIRLQSEFQRQIEKYLPNVQGVNVSVREKDGYYNISAEIDGVLYGIQYNTSNSKISSKYSKLSDLK